jgi:hypothetical protein
MQQQQELLAGLAQRVSLLMSLPMSVSVTIIQDNAASLPHCMSKTMRCYLLKSFPDIAVIPEDARWKSQPTNVNCESQSLRQLLLMVPQRQDSFKSVSSCSTSTSCSSGSAKSNASSITGSLAAQLAINRRQFLVSQTSNMSLVIRQSSTRRMGNGSAGLPRMPKRQDSATFMF